MTQGLARTRACCTAICCLSLSMRKMHMGASSRQPEALISDRARLRIRQLNSKTSQSGVHMLQLQLNAYMCNINSINHALYGVSKRVTRKQQSGSDRAQTVVNEMRDDIDWCSQHRHEVMISTDGSFGSPMAELAFCSSRRVLIITPPTSATIFARRRPPSASLGPAGRADPSGSRTKGAAANESRTATRWTVDSAGRSDGCHSD